ncbi:hypothetical protein ACSAZL_01760 [Methanosarcina sp. T3]|uniref:hypothetical protein n=1 Tax=Methanosarcina sp. T3 TaxID=3439062 RepID=UPI003F84B0F2
MPLSKVITHLGLSERIQIIEGNHFILPLESSCELYMVTAQAEPKKRDLNTSQKSFPWEAKFPTFYTKKVFEDYWIAVLSLNCLRDLKNASEFSQKLRLIIR